MALGGWVSAGWPESRQVLLARSRLAGFQTKEKFYLITVVPEVLLEETILLELYVRFLEHDRL
jgi:hypothetical protein